MQHPDCRVNAIDRWGRTALHAAAEAGSDEAVKVLVQHPDCHVNAIFGCLKRTALHIAAEAGSAETVKVLVQHPSCDISITDLRGLTAARLAICGGHDDISALIYAKCKGNFTKQFSLSDHTVAVGICPIALCLSLSTVAFSSA